MSAQNKQSYRKKIEDRMTSGEHFKKFDSENHFELTHLGKSVRLRVNGTSRSSGNFVVEKNFAHEKILSKEKCWTKIYRSFREWRGSVGARLIEARSSKGDRVAWA